MEFWKVCYAVKIVEEYKALEEQNENLENYFKRRAAEIADQKGFDKFITTHRMLLQGYMLGLMKKVDSKYKNAVISDVFKRIEMRCNGEFENVGLYYDILEMQIEKVFFSSVLDEKRNDIRAKYRVYPLFLLYKVLIEIGEITGKYEISRKEFVVFICTTEKYNDYLNTVFNILASRNNTGLTEEVNEIYSNLSGDVRYHKLLSSLNTIEETDNRFKIREGYENYVKEKIYLYETSEIVSDSGYIDILSSPKSLIRNADIENNTERNESVDTNNIEKNEIDNKISRNLIVYGAPGTGKSNKLEKEYREKYFNHEYLYSRVTFNPNYSYGDFIGVYKPTPIYVKDTNDTREFYHANKVDLLEDKMMPYIDYAFVCGPFVEMLCRALNDKEHNYLLLIEEINRADVATVFGDVFQLLDRDENGNSKYGIKFNKDVMNYIAGRVEDNNECFIKDELVKIPANMYILATMNSADQNVVKMDTAFKRRWDFDYISLDKYQDGAEDRYLELNFLEDKIKWNDFREVLNTYLSDILEVTEDKLIGPYFIEEVVEKDGVKYISESAFKNKLLSYLKDDVLRYSTTELFNKNYTFGKLIETYESGSNIFITNFVELVKKKVNTND
ncbi:AAA family ATPase [Clostridium baratii]|uniref:AAA family ATPase n=1 Tax=Clostridium baratii TaxID=1561 RepID=UPI003D7B8B2F